MVADWEVSIVWLKSVGWAAEHSAEKRLACSEN